MTNGQTSPSALFSDSIALFTQSATKAFDDLQTQVARAEANASTAQNERDQALKAMQESRRELQRYKEEILECKATLKNAELTIRHHVENYALLQREANHWRDQAKNWQEHFLRVEQERCALTSRIDELVTEQLIIPSITPKHPSCKPTLSISHSSMPRPPTYQSAALPPTNHDASSSEGPSAQHLPRPTTKAAKRKASVQSRSELPPYNKTVQTPHKPKASNSNSVSLPTRKQGAHPSSHSKQITEEPKEPKQILIRRVRAIVEVKQEEESDEDLSEAPPPQSPEGPALTPRRLHNTRRIRQIVDDDDYEPCDSSPEIGPNDAEEEAEDDELMIGAGDDLSFDVSSSSVPRQASATKTASNKKRKLNTAPGNKPKAKRKT